MIVPGLRSVYESVGGLVYFPRMLDKIRLRSLGHLPADYLPYLGGAPGGDAETFTHWDRRCCRFLRVEYGALEAEALRGHGDDAAMLEWAFSHGRRPTDEEIEIWNAFLLKRGWRDAATAETADEARKLGREPGRIVTLADLKDADELLPPRFPGGDGAGFGGAPERTTAIPGLRSPYETEPSSGLVYFPRMLDKIRLHADGKLPEDWLPARGNGFDGFCCRFLGVDYAALEAEALRGGGSDRAVLEWAFDRGRKPDAEQAEIWSAFMTKRSWRDAHASRLHVRLGEIGLPRGSYLTMFDFIDVDEGRPCRWEAAGRNKDAGEGPQVPPLDPSPDISLTN